MIISSHFEGNNALSSEEFNYFLFEEVGKTWNWAVEHEQLLNMKLTAV